MAASANLIDLRRPESEQTRVELTLGRIGQAWRLSYRGDQFTQAFLDFLRQLGSRETLRSYSFSILQFFDWYQQKNGRLVAPNEVRRADAIEFAKWLRERERGLCRWRLEQDPSRRLDQAIYDVVDKQPGIDLGGIRSSVAALSSEFVSYFGAQTFLKIEHPELGHPGGLAKHLGCLTKLKTLQRTPSVEEYRRAEGQLVIDPPAEIFRYFTPKVQTPEGAERSSSNATRLSALSSLWTYFMRSAAENVRGSDEPLLKHNIWLEPLKQVRLQAPSHQAATRAKKTPNLELFFYLLATTFYRTHGRDELALQAAQAAFWGQQVPIACNPTPATFKDLRDRALLLLMGQTGVRSFEVHRLKRQDVAGRPPSITVLGKRGKKRVIGMPPAVLQALVEMGQKIAEIAVHQARYAGHGRADSLLTPAAPLLPAIAYWGANAGHVEQGLTRPGIALMLRRRAISAGLEPSDVQFAKIHPHGLRHLFVKTAIDSGTPINRVQAIVGHASAAQTARYAEERAPEMLIADVFKVAPESSPAPAAPAPVTGGRAWTPEEGAIVPPALPKARLAPPRRPSRVVEEPVEGVGMVVEPEVAPLVPLAPSVAPLAPPIVSAAPAAPKVQRAAPPTVSPPTVAEARSPSGFNKVLQFIAQKRGRPLTNDELKSVAKCKNITNETFRNLCIIYDVHWGEEGNRQALLKSGGGRRKKKHKLSEEEATVSSLSDPMVANSSEFEDEEYEFDEGDDNDDDLPTYEELLGLEEIEPTEIERAEQAKLEQKMAAWEAPKDLYAESGTTRSCQIYSGKLSGLPWWAGSHGKLTPEMPIMSADQIGACVAMGDQQSPVCEGLVKLWRDWFVSSPTKAEALVKWVEEALDTAAQLQDTMAEGGSDWVESEASWDETKYLGIYRSPKPRKLFREHLDLELIAWFKAVAGQYRTTPGDPEQWRARTARPKVKGESPPDWYTEPDPVFALSFDERSEMLDWIQALTGLLPDDTEPKFGLGGQLYRASRKDIGRWVNAMCTFDGMISVMRDEESQARAGKHKVGSMYVSDLLHKDSIDKFPSQLKIEFRQAQTDVRLALSEATGGRHGDFDFFSEIKRRLKRRKTGENLRSGLSIWYLGLVKKYFGKEAAADPSIKLVTKCGRVPLAEFKELFNVERGTIRHPHDYKRHFALQFGVHSECVARRIARDLWEVKKHSPTGKFMTSPQHMRMLVEVGRTYKVPCTEDQETELRMFGDFANDPTAIYRQWEKVHTAPGAAREELTEAERHEEELQEEFEEERARMFAVEVAGPPGYERNPPLRLPTPIHFLVALGI